MSGKIFINGYNHLIEYIPGGKVLSVEKNDECFESRGEVGEIEFNNAPLFNQLYVVLPEIGCEFTCSYCWGRVAMKTYGKESSLQKLDEILSDKEKFKFRNIIIGGMGEHFINPYLDDYLKVMFKHDMDVLLVGNIEHFESVEKYLTEKNITLCISLELGKDVDRGANFEKILSKVSYLAGKYPTKVSVVPMIPLDVDEATVSSLMDKVLKAESIGGSWSVILPCYGARELTGDPHSKAKLISGLLPTTLPVMNILGNTIINILLYGFFCSGIQQQFLLGDKLVSCPVNKNEITTQDLTGIQDAKNKSCKCKVNGSIFTCGYSEVPESSKFNEFFWHLVALSSEKSLKNLFKTDEEIVAFLNSDRDNRMISFDDITYFNLIEPRYGYMEINKCENILVEDSPLW